MTGGRATIGLASFALAVLVTAAALWFLAPPATLPQLRAAAAAADWRALCLAVLLGAAVQWLRAWRFAIMTRGRLDLPDAPQVRIAFQLNLFNFLLPFRLGELSYPVLMRRQYGQPLLEAAGVLLLARLFDFAAVAALFCASAAMLGLAGSSGANLLLASAAVTLASVPTVLMLGGRAAQRLLLRSVRFGGFAARVGAGLGALGSRRARLAVVALSFAVWLTFAALAVCAAGAAAEGIGPLVALFGGSAGALAFALPVNGIAGLGPSQAAWVAAVTQAGVPWHAAVASALSVYVATFGSAVLFGGLALATGGRLAIAPAPDVDAPRGQRP